MVFIYVFFATIVALIILIQFNSIKIIKKINIHDDNIVHISKNRNDHWLLITENIVDYYNWAQKHEKSLVIVLSSSCAHCREVFEYFWYEIFYMRITNMNVLILVDRDDINIQNYLKLYEHSFSMKHFNKPFIENNKLVFMPAFIFSS